MQAEQQRVEAWLDDAVAQMEQQAERAQTFADVVGALCVTASNPDGSIRVTVDRTGAVTELHIGDGATRTSGPNPSGSILSAQILAVMRRAQSGLAQQVAVAAAQTLGEDSSIGRACVQEYSARFPVPPDETERRHAR